jgi:hypothetical protein
MNQHLLSAVLASTLLACTTDPVVLKRHPDLPDDTGPPPPCATAPLPRAPVAVQNPSVASTVDGLIYLFFGYNPVTSSLSRDVYAFDPMGSWTWVTELPQAMEARPPNGAVEYLGTIFLLTGSDLWSFDPAAKRFAYEGALPSSSGEIASIAGDFDGLVFFSTDGEAVNYAIQSHQVEALPKLPSKVSLGAVVAVTRYQDIFAIGEQVAAIHFPTVAWRSAEPLVHPRRGHSALTIGAVI